MSAIPRIPDLYSLMNEGMNWLSDKYKEILSKNKIPGNSKPKTKRTSTVKETNILIIIRCIQVQPCFK